MSNFPHDDFAKAYLVELLSTIGTAIPNSPLKAETREADLWFQSKPGLQDARSQLGLLGQLLPKDSLIEVFRNPANPIEIRSCKGKLFSLEADLIRKAKQKDITLTESDFPFLLLLMPTASADIREGFGAVQTAIEGVYALPKWERTTIVVLHQLPKTQETLWLRLLGRAGNQRRAIEEFAEMPTDLPLYASIRELLADYRAMLQSRRSTTKEEEELIMNLSAAYLKKKEEWREETIYDVTLNLLREGVVAEVIVKATGLTLQEVNKLREKLG
jgi:hypothetical protein